MLNTNYVSDNTGNLFSLFDGSVTNEGSVATMPSSTTEPTSGVNDAADNQQDWDEFDSDIYCRCGCAYKLSIRIACDESSGIEQIHYKEVMVSCNCYVT